jgi:uncharacterized protein (TIGR02246 family)
MEEVSALYHALLDAWNRHDAVGYAALFADDGYVVGFDGSEMKGRHESNRASARSSPTTTPADTSAR